LPWQPVRPLHRIDGKRCYFGHDLEADVPSDVEVTGDVSAPRAVVWEALFDLVGRGSHPPSLRMGDTVVHVDMVDPPAGLTGTAVWDGFAHRLAVHLVDNGGAATLVLVTAEAQADEPSRFGVRTAVAQHHARRDARRDIEHWLEGVLRRSDPGER
jgi:hypothetical protein